MADTMIYALSVSARALLNMHSLNNEGGEGNQTQTRMVDVIIRDAEGEPRQVSVNAISGDMFKHMQAAHLHRIALNGNDLALCEACAKFDANRISADPDFRAFVQQKEAPTPVQVIDYMLERCTVDDLEGNLITEGKQATARKSIGEFGWVIGIPDAVTTDDYFHVKYAPDRRQRPNDKDDREGNLGQAIFHRPASSGIYAMVCHFDLARIGFNDISQRYTLTEGDRKHRYRALLESVLYTFLEPNGAMRNTQLPHIMDFNGAVSLSYGTVPAPALSPLNAGYVNEMREIASTLNALHEGNVVEVLPFSNMAEFTGIMRDVIQNSSPYRLNVGHPIER